MDSRRIDEIRRANFPTSRRGYDRDAVDDFLDHLAASLEEDAAVPEPEPEPAGPTAAVRREIEQLGERTSGILSAAQEAADKVRTDAETAAAELKERVEEQTRTTRLEAQERSERLVADAEAKAEKIIDDAVARRRRLNRAIASLAGRREEIVQETQRLVDELMSAIGKLGDFDATEHAGPDEQPAAAAAATPGPASPTVAAAVEEPTPVPESDAHDADEAEDVDDVDDADDIDDAADVDDANEAETSIVDRDATERFDYEPDDFEPEPEPEPDTSDELDEEAESGSGVPLVDPDPDPDVPPPPIRSFTADRSLPRREPPPPRIPDPRGDEEETAVHPLPPVDEDSRS